MKEDSASSESSSRISGDSNENSRTARTGTLMTGPILKTLGILSMASDSHDSDEEASGPEEDVPVFGRQKELEHEQPPVVVAIPPAEGSARIEKVNTPKVEDKKDPTQDATEAFLMDGDEVETTATVTISSRPPTTFGLLARTGNPYDAEVPGAYALAANVLAATYASHDAATPNNNTGNSGTQAETALPVAQGLDLEEAELVCSETQTELRRSSKQVPHATLWIGISLFVAAITFLLVFTLGGNSETNVEATQNNTTTTTNAAEANTDYLLGILPEGSLITVFQESNHSSSPQKLAFEWLVKDPYLQTNYSVWRLIQRFALATFYFATQGRLWSQNDKWLSYSHNECNWYVQRELATFGQVEESSLPCNADGVLERIWLRSNNLNGTIPEEFYLLTSLLDLEVIMNPNLRGTIGTEIGQLTNLSRISLFACGMDGTIPSEIGMLSQLQKLYLGALPTGNSNNFHGMLPSEFSHLINLETVTLHFNDFSGTLPSGRNLKSLQSLGFQGNLFTGSIPNDWIHMTNMMYFYLFDNLLTGSIPPLFNQHSQYLTMLGLHVNQLSGTIPSNLGSFTNLKELTLSDNTLEGTLPSELGQLSDLFMLFLSHNSNLVGTIPTQYAQLSRMDYFDIRETNITGFIPEVLQNASHELTFERFFFECQNQLNLCA